MTEQGGVGTSRVMDACRRAMDIVVALTLALVTLPVMVGAALGSAVSLRAWPLFAQERIGRDGRAFRFFKIRTLPVSMPAYADKFELDHDQIPPFCRLLRALHLDELPQLYLVLIGRMTLVGPRPEMRYLHEQMPTAVAASRTSVRPGCTGLWQVSTACTGLIVDAPEYDQFHLEHRTLRLDGWILYRTALKMTKLAKPVTFDDIPAWTLAPSPADALRANEQFSDAPVASAAAAGR